MLRKQHLAAVLVAGVLTLTGCAGGDDTTTKNADGTSNITVGAIAVAPDLPLVVGESEGIFSKHDLDVKIDSNPNFGAVLPKVLNGELQVGFSSAVPLINAAAQGAPLKVIAVQEYTDAADIDPADATLGVMVPKGSTLTRPRDLEGKKLGIVARGNSDILAVLNAVAEDGGDPTKIQLLEMGMGEPLIQSLAKGDVDAITGGEPTRTVSEAEGFTMLFPALADGLPDLPYAAYFTTAKYAEQNPDVIKDFQAAVEEASELARTDDAATRAAIPEFLSLDSDLAAQIRLGSFRTDWSVEDWQDLVTIGQKYDVIDKGADLDQLLLESE